MTHAAPTDPQARQKHWDAQYADLERDRPRPQRYANYNSYCRAMDEWSAAYSIVLNRDGRDACRNA